MQDKVKVTADQYFYKDKAKKKEKKEIQDII